MTGIWERLEARGLNVEALASKGWSVERDRAGGEFLTIPFVVDGVVAGRKMRWFDHPDRKWMAKWDDGPVAYNTDCLKDDALLGHPLIIAEGEVDLESFLVAGYQRVISVPNGAGGSAEGRTEADLADAKAYEWFRKIKPLVTPDRVKEVILATDGDEAGARLMHELSVQFGRFRCRFVTYPKTRRPELGRPRTKDANEVLMEYGAKGLVETINRANWIAIPGIYKMSDLPPVPQPKIYDIGFDLLGENYKMRMGDFVVVTGMPGFGKSSLINDLCCRVAQRHGLKTSWLSLEQSPQTDHKRALRSWFLEMRPRAMTVEDKDRADRWIDEFHTFMVPTEDDDPTLEWLLDMMEVAAVRYGTNIIVIDPLNELESVRRRDESETEYIGRFIRTMKRFAKKFQVHIILAAHPAKMMKVNGKYPAPTLYDISGSAHFYNKADLGLIVHREDADNTSIKVQKSRYHDVIGKPGEVRMQYCMDTRRYIECERLA